MNRYLRDLARSSPTLQHRRELFAIGLIDNPCCPCDLVERRKLREGYEHKWSDGASVIKSVWKLPPTQPIVWGRAEYFGNGLLASRASEIHGLTLLHIPQVASQTPIGSWSIPPSPFDVFGYAVYPPENVIAVAEQGVR